MAALDPVAFVRATPPFDALPATAFAAVEATIDVVEHPAGARVIRRGGEPAEHLFVIVRGVVRLERDGEGLQVLEEGETFGITSLISGHAALDVVVQEDLVACRVPRAAFEPLLREPAFAGHFASGLAERLRRSLDHPQVATFQPDLAAPAGALPLGPAVRVAAGATIREAAGAMSAAGSSCAIVDTDPPGIVTDADLRRRVLSEGLPGDGPVARVATRPLRTVPASTPVYEIWRTILEAGVHHLPVVDGGELRGVLTSTDLLRYNAAGPVAAMRLIEELPGREALAGYATRVARMAAALLAGGLEPFVIGGFVARLNDTVLARILRWAEAELPPPAPYAWLVFGSEGRMEQTLLTDQDNALVHADRSPASRAWAAAFARRVNDDLEAAGFPACPGGYMATRWHGPLDEWIERFRGWVYQPTPRALLEASIFFDFRRAHGTLDVSALEEARARTGDARVFLAAMAKGALSFRPPTGLLLRVRGDSSRLDLKAVAISPIVFLARVYGLEVGAVTSGTIGRLEAACEAGRIERDTLETLSESYRFLLRLRLREQLRALAAGRTPTNVVAMGDLSSLERSRLKDVFRAIEGWQARAAYHYRTQTF
jgi:CBS domain-containing protein